MFPRLRLATTLALFSAALAAADRAQGQIFTGSNPTAGVAMPQAAPKAGLTAPDAPTAAADMRHMPGTLDGWRLTGEVSELRWPVYLTDRQARGIRRMKVTYAAAISVLPEASFLELRINDRMIGREPLDGGGGRQTIELDVPPGALERGFNAISLAVSQRHRVDCSVQAAYELWTRVDPSETGLVLAPGTRGITDVSDLAAILPRSDGSLPIHILLSGKTNPAHLRRLLAATQSIALAAHALQPIIDFDAEREEPEGIDLALGTRAALGKLPRLAPSLGSGGPLISIIPSQTKGRPTLVVSGTNDVEVDAAIDRLRGLRELRGAAAGRSLVARYPAMAPSGRSSLTLADFGIRSREFGGRLFHEKIDVELPPDILTSDYGRGTLDLAGGYAAGLERTAQIRIDVNGGNAGIIKLPNPEGEVFAHNQLFLPLGQMRPGLNRIDLIAALPRMSDAECSDRADRRFLLLERTRLQLPTLAHVLRLPDLALATSGGAPYDRGKAHLVIPKPDRATVAAALSFATREAVASGRLVPFDFLSRMPAKDDGSTLVISPARELDPGLMSAVGLDPQAVEKAWRNVVPPAVTAERSTGPRWWMPRREGPLACRTPAMVGPRLTPERAPSRRNARPSGDDDAFIEAWTPSSRTSWVSRLSSVMRWSAQWIGTQVRDIRPSFLSVDRPIEIDASASLILAQGMSPGSRTNVTTIVTAPSAAHLAVTMACLFDPQVWPNLRGRLAVLDASDGNVQTMDARSFHYVASGAPSVANTRLVVAGWFSLNPLAFAAAALVTAFCLGGTTLCLVRNIGRSSA